MRCAKMAEPIEMQFEIESGEFSESRIRWGADAPMGATFVGCLAD